MGFSKMVTFVCAIAFIIQMYLIAESYVWPTLTNTESSQVQLSDIDFPVLFKVCVKPGFEYERLVKKGYESLEDYFHGRSRFKNDLFGWNGHWKLKQNFESMEGLEDKCLYNLI